MPFRKLTVALLLVFMLSLGMSTAQGQGLDVCLGLDAAACEAINSATENTLAATSFFQTFTITFNLANVPGEPAPITFAVTGSGPVTLDMMSMDLPINFDQTLVVTLPGEQMATVQARLLDGIMYVQTAEGEPWMGINLVEAMNNPEMSGLPIDPEALSDPSALLADLPFDPTGLLMALPQALSAPGFLSYTNAGPAYTFVADFAALFSSPEFSSVLQAAGEAANDPSIASFGMILPMIVPSATITVNQVINTGGNYVENLTFTADATIAAGMLTGESAADPIELDLVFNVQITQVNEGFSIVAPENVQMAPMGN